MDFNFKTIHDFNDYLKDEETCYRFLESQRWNGTPVCPHCAFAKTPYVVKARGKFQDIPSYRSSERGCKLPFTVRTGSIYEGSKVELRKWFQAAYEISTSKKGISSVELATRIDVSQKTAWFLNHRIRTMLTETTPEMLEGTVEADETFVGGKNKNRHASKKVANSQGRAHVDKTAVVGMLQRNGKIKTCVVADTSADTLHTLMVKNVAPQAVVITDAYQSYKGLKNTSINTFPSSLPKVVTKPLATTIPTTLKAFGANLNEVYLAFTTMFLPNTSTVTAPNLKLVTMGEMKAMLHSLLNSQNVVTNEGGDT